MKKITIITPYWLNTKGGITTVVYDLFNELKNLYEVTILTPDKGIGSIQIPKSIIKSTIKTILIIKKINPDIIHVHAHGSLLLAPVIYKLLIKKKAKIFFTFHTQPHYTSFLKSSKKTERERSNLRLFILNHLLKYCDATTYVSQSLMNCLEKTRVKGNNPVVVYNGVKKREVTPDEINDFKKNYNIKNKYPILCMIANLSWDWKAKGVEILIDALNKINKYFPSSLLIIIGGGKYKNYIENYVKKLGIEKNVIFTGNMDNPFIVLHLCDIYCHISLNEACPIAPLEAMTMGKLIIASNNAGLPELIKHNVNGILVEPNPKQISMSILGLLNNNNLMNKLQKNTTKTVKEKFSWTKITKEYIKLYESN